MDISTATPQTDVQTVEHTPIVDISTMGRDLLITVRKHGPICPMDAKREVLDDLYDRTLHKQTIYRARDALLDANIVDVREWDGRTTVMEITDRGDEAIEAYLQWACD